MAMKNGHNIRMIIYLILTLTVMAAIFFFSSQDGVISQRLSDSLLELIEAIIALLPEITGEGAAMDIRKYAHIFMFFALGVCSWLLFHEVFISRDRRIVRAALASWPFCFIYACSDEAHQYFVPGRAGLMSDVIIDSASFTAGIAALMIIFYIRAAMRGKRGASNE